MRRLQDIPPNGTGKGNARFEVEKNLKSGVLLLLAKIVGNRRQDGLCAASCQPFLSMK